MEIAIGIFFLCVVVAVGYFWAGRSTRMPEEAVRPADPRYGLYSNTANSYRFGDVIQSIDNSGGSTDVTGSSASDTTSQQDCCTDSGPDDSSVNCPCPGDSTSYDSGGCSVDSSDVGNSN